MGLAVVSGVIVGAPAQAQPGSSLSNPAVVAAASGCGSVCDGKNPATYYVTIGGITNTCASDAVTLDYAPREPAAKWVELRWSPRCQTAWARTVNSLFYPSINSYTINTFRRSYQGPISGQLYTKMVNDAYPYYAEACAAYGPTEVCTYRR